MLASLEDITKIVREARRAEAVFTRTDGTKGTARLAISCYGGLMVMAKGKRNRGYPISDFIRREQVADLHLKEAGKEKKSEADTWRASWENVLARLEKSGLWAEYKEQVKTALAVGYDKIKKAYEVYWGDEYKDRREGITARKIQAIDPRLVVMEDGNMYADTSVIGYMNTPAKVKKMYFSKYGNELSLKKIAAALAAHEDCSESGRASYDVSFRYQAKDNKAWYSEEYKNCGNGHYYLALDATHAVFYEDD